LLDKALGGGSATDTLVDASVTAGAVIVDDAGLVRFAHPLLASAVYHAMPPARRRSVHQSAARVVGDPVQEARHLALSTKEPDAAVAGALDRAALTAAERGAPEAAAALAAEAVRLTPVGEDDARVRRTLLAAGLSIEAGSVGIAREHIAPLLEAGVQPAVRAQALVLRAETEHRDRALLRACLREAIDVAPDPRVRWQALIRYAQHGGWVSGDAEVAARSAREALRIAVELDDQALTDAAMAALAYYEAGRGDRSVSFGEAELVHTERLQRTAPWQITPPISVGSRLLWAGELDRARDVLRTEYEALVRQGNLLRLPLVLLTALVDVEWRAGRWDAAEHYAQEAAVILEDALPGAGHVVLYTRIIVAGSRGRLDDARRLAAEGIEVTCAYDDFLNGLRIRWAIGHVELAAGNAPAAAKTLEPMPDELARFGIRDPGWQPVLPDVVDVLVQLGRLADAETVLQELERQAAALTHTWGTPAALRCRAVLLLAREQAERPRRPPTGPLPASSRSAIRSTALERF
jgi:hypothetical protein